ncbi:hypothetical protein QTP88_018157 [Uroleucon formosanum]
MRWYSTKMYAITFLPASPPTVSPAAQLLYTITTLRIHTCRRGAEKKSHPRCAIQLPTPKSKLSDYDTVVISFQRPKSVANAYRSHIHLNETDEFIRRQLS